ncbi:uncharacterized protein MCYG_04762 [Microsporum canis CBS 113480]|uniref:Uncharacterized protein n=1 Tax=Arthroderma otae (strain ATCC MYA-4605 / CBS 113480) TaxID=554155 RepID=C5FPZ0_ARTOC|nr:uncharacterized protein MCYG_04762 [Microsporum canis CBS 113480]EEQ31943.1 predicted protein [Microsporum canis CBS 113480]
MNFLYLASTISPVLLLIYLLPPDWEKLQKRCEAPFLRWPLYTRVKRIIGNLLWPSYYQPIDKLLPLDCRSPIYSLNNDAVYYITSMLPPADAAAFVLSCRAIWQAAGGQNFLTRLSKSDESCLDFFERIEADYPKHVLCYRCKKFHSHCRSPSGLKPDACDTESSVHFLGPPKDYRTWHLTYRQAKEVMNHYRFGPTHGRCAPKAIHYHTFAQEINQYQHYVKGVWNFDMKFIGNNLILREDIWIKYKLDGHLSTSDAVSMCEGWNKHLSLGRAMGTNDELHSCYRCPYSSSEREIQVSYLRYKPGYGLLRSTLWENLGACQNSDTDLWNHGTWFNPCTFSPLAIDPAELRYKHHFDTRLPARDHSGWKVNFW